jgi:hypothetical protein
MGSFVEAWANIAVGFGINFAANLLVLPWFGFHVTAGQALGIGVIFTAISLARSYILRRWFNGLRFGNTREVTIPIRIVGAPGASLPADTAARGEYPMADGLLYYFPAALAEVARVSKVGNDQHNPGQPMHWARGKSMDHGNKIIRHQVDAGTLDADGTRHSAKVAWRALAQLQEELEQQEGAPLPRNARAAA